MAAEDEVRQASEQFYATLNRVLHGDARPMEQIWSHGSDVSAMHLFGGRILRWEEMRASWEQAAQACSDGQVALDEMVVFAITEDAAYTLGTEHGQGRVGDDKGSAPKDNREPKRKPRGSGKGGLLFGLLIACLALLLLVGPLSSAKAAQRSVDVPCGADIDNVINNDPSGTATIFVLGADCTFTASATVVPKNGDEIYCRIPPTGTILAGSWPLAAVDPATRCTIQGASTLATVMKPQGYFYGEGFTVRGGDFKGSAGTGVGIQEGQMSNNSYLWRVIVRDNEAAGISVGRGTHDEVELTNNTTNPKALGYIGSGIKSAYEFSVQHSYVHDTQGNGIWCDVHCKNVSGAPFSAAHFNANLVVNNGRAGIRWERIGKVRCGSDCDPNAGQGVIENNFVHGNGRAAVRGGIDVRDAQDALVRDNVFGAATYAGISYRPNAGNVAIRVTDSGRADRPDLYNIDVVNNRLNGETITGCSLPVDVAFCSNNF